MAVGGAPWGGLEKGGAGGDISQQRPPPSSVRRGEMPSSSPVARRYYDIRPSCPTTASVAAAASTLVKEEDGRRYWAAVGDAGGVGVGGGGGGGGKRLSASGMPHSDQDLLYLPLVVTPREEILRREALDIIAVRERWGRRNRDYEGRGGCVSDLNCDSLGRERWKHMTDARGRGGEFPGDRDVGYGPSGHREGRVVGRTGAAGDCGRGAMQMDVGHERFRSGLPVPPVLPLKQQRELVSKDVIYAVIVQENIAAGAVHPILVRIGALEASQEQIPRVLSCVSRNDHSFKRKRRCVELRFSCKRELLTHLSS